MSLNSGILVCYGSSAEGPRQDRSGKASWRRAHLRLGFRNESILAGQDGGGRLSRYREQLVWGPQRREGRLFCFPATPLVMKERRKDRQAGLGGEDPVLSEETWPSSWVGRCSEKPGRSIYLPWWGSSRQRGAPRLLLPERFCSLSSLSAHFRRNSLLAGRPPADPGSLSKGMSHKEPE